MFDNGTLMMGYTDDVFRYLVNTMEHVVEADGEVEAPTGWFAHLDRPSRSALAHAVSITGSPRAGESGVFDPEAIGYLVRINSDGLIWAHEYKYHSDLAVDWRDVKDQYDAWAEPAEEPPTSPTWGPWGSEGRQGN